MLSMLGFQYNQREKEVMKSFNSEISFFKMLCEAMATKSNFKEEKTYKQVLYIGNIKTRKTENELQCIAGMSGRSVKVCLL